MVEDAVNRLEKKIRTWHMPYPIRKDRIHTLIKSLKARLMAIKYSYLPVELLIKSDDIKELMALSKELANLILPPKGLKLETKYHLHLAELKYSLLQLIGLRQRFLLGEENRPEYSIDIIGVEIVTVMKHPRSNKLFITKAGTEKYSFTVVTNLAEIKQGDIRAVAILPPIELMGIVSEAMYCSGIIPSSYKGKRVPLKYIDSKGLNNKVMEVINKLRK
jgi:hypothetical protein